MKPDDFLEFVHEIDHSPLLPNAELGDAIEKLPGRKLILTNGTRKHAEAVMKRLDIDRHFEDVFDIAAADLDPKPLPQVYDRFLHKHGVDPQKAAMFEDLARNLERAARARHDHRAGGAAGHARGVPRGLGAGGPRGRPCRSRHRRSDGISAENRRPDARLPRCRTQKLICGRGRKESPCPARRSRQDHRRRLREARRHQRPRPRARCARRSRRRSTCSTAARRASPSAAATAPGPSISG